MKNMDLTVEVGTLVDTDYGRGTVIAKVDGPSGEEYQVEGASFTVWVTNPAVVKQADWVSVQAKGRRLYEDGMVEIESITSTGATGLVQGHSGRTYEVSIGRMALNDERLQEWTCGCDWDRHLPERTTLTDQPCSHAIALMFATGLDQIRANRHGFTGKAGSLAWERDADGTLFAASPGGIYYRIRQNRAGGYDVETSRLNNEHINNKRGLGSEDEAMEWAEKRGTRVSRQVLAGKAYTDLEQQELIDEDGLSEESILRLDLTGTHYLLP